MVYAQNNDQTFNQLQPAALVLFAPERYNTIHDRINYLLSESSCK